MSLFSHSGFALKWSTYNMCVTESGPRLGPLTDLAILEAARAVGTVHLAVQEEQDPLGHQ